MKRFLGRTLATIVGLALFIVLVVGIFAIIIKSSKKEVEVKEKSVLTLKLNKPIRELSKDSPFSNVDLPLPGSMGTLGLNKIKKAIKEASQDERIKGIFLNLKDVKAGMSTTYEIRENLKAFKDSGKFIIAYADVLDEKTYYLASVADEVYVNPAGDLEFNGLATQISFFKGTFEKLDIEPQIFRVGTFKSAVEPFIRKDMSEPNRLQIRTFLEGIYDQMLSDISQSRGIDKKKLRMISDSMMVHNTKDAVKYGLIDDMQYIDGVHDKIKQRLNPEAEESKEEEEEDDDEEEEEKEEKINFISMDKYNQAKKDWIKPITSLDRVAVIVGQGQIVMEGDEDEIVGNKLAAQIREARKDENVKAIVLRVNSPGGSATASDIMWREVQLAKKEKPVIASMSDVAASGGYYMSMGADTIVATPVTITGSIGVFGLFFRLDDLMQDKLGVTYDQVETGEHSLFMSPFHPLTDYEKSIIQKSVEAIYDTFTTKAAQGRNVAQEDILEVAGGRVWTGKDAQGKKLVDVMGTLDDAIAIAAKSAKLKEGEYKVKYIPKKKNFIEELTKDFSASVEQKIMQENNSLIGRMLKQTKELPDYRGIQTRMPYELRLE